MKKIYRHIKENFIKGLIFLLPILVIMVLIAKAMAYLKGFSTKIAALFGLKSIAGVSGTTIISTLSIVAICVLAGYFVRLRFMANFRNRLDQKLGELLPGYESYRQMAIQKIKNEEEKLPYTMAVLINENYGQIPGFLMETLKDGRLIIFIPLAGNPKEGSIRILPAEKVILLENAAVKQVFTAILKTGNGLGAAIG